MSTSGTMSVANNLSGRFEFKRLVGFAWPTIAMLIFMSLYSMVDGAFVSRLLGTTALSAVNIFFPFITGFYGVGIMLASGSAAIVARLMGEGEPVRARRTFTFMICVAIFTGAVIGVAGYVFLEPLLRLLGARGELVDLCRNYALPVFPFVPMALLQMMFQSYFVAAGRPGLGLAVIALGGVTNIILDYVFMAVLGYGIGGAALATGVGYSLPALLGLLYFGFNRRGTLYLVKFAVDLRALFHSVVNGSSEMVSNISAAVVGYLFNITMLRHIGVGGVAAITIILYAEFLLNSIYFGFATGVSPLFSYKFGKGDAGQLRKLFKDSLMFVAMASALSITAAFTLGGSIIAVFTPVGSEVFGYAHSGLKLFSISFAFMGFNVFFSALFTALSNGKISALLAFSRSVLIAAFILILPGLLGVNGIWLAVPVAEVVTVALGLLCILRYRRIYHYA